MLIAQNLKLTPEKISALLVGRTGLLLLGSTMSSLVEAMLAKAGVHSLLHERSFDILRGELKKPVLPTPMQQATAVSRAPPLPAGALTSLERALPSILNPGSGIVVDVQPVYDRERETRARDALRKRKKRAEAKKKLQRLGEEERLQIEQAKRDKERERKKKQRRARQQH